MELNTVLELMAEHGVKILLTITFLEAMNCPGMPAGVVLPAAGICAAGGDMSLLLAIALTVIGGTAGTTVLYLIGFVGGHPLLEWLKRRSSAVCKACEHCEEFLQKGGFVKLFVGRLLPVVRTLLPLPAGALQLPFRMFLTASALGIICYNTVFVCAGYFLGAAMIS